MQALLNLPTNIGVTATLSLKYKKPTFANQYLVIRTELVEQKGRKARVKARIENTEGETLVEAECVERCIPRSPSSHARLQRLIWSSVLPAQVALRRTAFCAVPIKFVRARGAQVDTE